MINSIQEYTANLHAYLSSLGNEEIAYKQSKYMRFRFSYFGIMKSEQEKYYKEFQNENGVISIDQAKEFCQLCLHYPEREIWYIGIGTLVKYKKKLPKESLTYTKELIVKADWWDLVDGIAPHIVGSLVSRYPELKSEVNEWVHSENFWLRRSSLIYQLGYRNETDEKALYQNILLLCHEKEFFIRKAIGWSLREYAKHNPDSVRKFVDQHQEKLSTLSYREATKYL